MVATIKQAADALLALGSVLIGRVDRARELQRQEREDLARFCEEVADIIEAAIQNVRNALEEGRTHAPAIGGPFWLKAQVRRLSQPTPRTSAIFTPEHVSSLQAAAERLYQFEYVGWPASVRTREEMNEALEPLHAALGEYRALASAIRALE